MILVYNYENACKVVDLFSKNQIIALKIYQDESLGKENANFVFDFKTFEDYPEEEHTELRSRFNEKNLSSFVKATSALTTFVSMMEIENVLFFNMNFEIGKVFSCTKAFGEKEVEEPSDEAYEEFINRFEKYVTKAGIYKMNIPAIFVKNTNPSNTKQRNPKYVTATFGQLINILKDVNLDG